MRYTFAVGIDPGLDGAIALYRPEQADAELRLVVQAMPTREIVVSGKKRREVDGDAVLSMARQIWAKATEAALEPGAQVECLLAVEKVHGLPGQSGSAAFNFGYGTAVATSAFKWTMPRGGAFCTVTPQRWKGEVGIPLKDRSSKDASRAFASQIFPAHAGLWKNKNKDGWAEAALLAYWMATQER